MAVTASTSKFRALKYPKKLRCDQIATPGFLTYIQSVDKLFIHNKVGDKLSTSAPNLVKVLSKILSDFSEVQSSRHEI